MTMKPSDPLDPTSKHSVVPSRPPLEAVSHVIAPEIKYLPATPLPDNGTKNAWIACFAVIVAACLGLLATIYTSSQQILSNERAHQADLQRKDLELMLKQDEGKKLNALDRIKLIQDIADLSISDAPNADLKLTALAKFGLPIPDATLILQNAQAVRREMEERKARQVQASKVMKGQESVAQTATSTVGSTAQELESIKADDDPMSTGRAYVRSGDFERATASFTRATMIDPNNALAWSFKGYCEYRTHRLPEAIQSINQGLKLNSQDETARQYLIINGAKVLCAQNRISEASEFFNKSAALFPSVVAKAQGDGQLQKECKWIWQ